MTFDNFKEQLKLTVWPLQVYRTMIKRLVDSDSNKWNDMLLTLENNWILTAYLRSDNKS